MLNLTLLSRDADSAGLQSKQIRRGHGLALAAHRHERDANRQSQAAFEKDSRWISVTEVSATRGAQEF